MIHKLSKIMKISYNNIPHINNNIVLTNELVNYSYKRNKN